MPLSRDLRATRRARAWASVMRVSSSTAAVVRTIRDGLVPRPLVASVTNRHLRSHAESRHRAEDSNALIRRTWPASRSGFPPGNARTARSRPTTAQSRDATRMSSHGANPRSTRLSSVDEIPAASATVASDRPAAAAGRTKLGAQIGEQAPAAAGATARVRLRHRHILSEHAHQPINSRRYPPATIEP